MRGIFGVSTNYAILLSASEQLRLAYLLIGNAKFIGNLSHFEISN